MGRSIVSSTEALGGLIVVVVTMDRVDIAGGIGNTEQIRGELFELCELGLS